MNLYLENQRMGHVKLLKGSLLQWFSQGMGGFLVLGVVLGYSRKYPHPLWTTLNWVTKNFRISKKDNCSFCRIPEPADSKS